MGVETRAAKNMRMEIKPMCFGKIVYGKAESIVGYGAVDF